MFQKVTRVGVYGVAKDDEKILVIRQQRGPFAGKLDFPGGGIEFGESPEQALRREFAEEVAMEFNSLQLINNMTYVIEVPGTEILEPYHFFHIGMLYRVQGCRSMQGNASGELWHEWVDLAGLSKDECSQLLWNYKQKL